MPTCSTSPTFILPRGYVDKDGTLHRERDVCLDMSHRERHAWVKEISAINEKINAPK